MKIRTDFVTNSSSYSSAEVVIDNPVLMEILIKYKEMGIFEQLFIWNCLKIGDHAFSYEAPEAYEAPCPVTLAGVLGCLIEALLDAELRDDEGLFDQLIDELNQSEEEISQEYISVYWHERIDMQSGAYEESYFRFNSESGETYEHKQVGIDEDFED